LDKLLSPNNYVLKTVAEDKWQSGTKNVGVPSVSSQLLEIYSGIESSWSLIRKAIFYKNVRPALFKMGLIRELRSLFIEQREIDNVQTLSDFYRILSDRFASEQTPFIYERLGNQYHHILIDEFQDTSTLQWKNL